MFYSITGNVVFSDENSVAIDCGSVAYLVFTSLNSLKTVEKNGTVTFFTYLNVREDAMELYGFVTKKELESFKLLISVSGVGPKAALAILSQFSPEGLASAIAVGDSKAITRAQGVGPKLAQRVVLELKGKMDIDLEEIGGVRMDDISSPEQGSVAEAINALIQLGYSRTEAVGALKGTDASSSTEELIKHALKYLAFQG